MIHKFLIFLVSRIPFLSNYFLGVATIFMLHRVDMIDNNKIFANENMKISPKFLEKFILELKDQGFDFISMDELYQLLITGRNTKKKIVMTLDDGYVDNFTQAHPIFKKYQIPFTIYITTSFPEKNAILWWYVLEELLHQYSEIRLSDGSYYTYQSLEEKNQVFLDIRSKILKLDQTNLLQELNQLFYGYTIDWYKYTQELAMTWEQIKQLSLDPLVTIAGHTKNHYAFNRISDELIRDEINEANVLIHQHTGKMVKYFAFPFGSIHEVEKKQIEWVKSFGFKTVVTTRKGNIFKQHKNYLYCLPRIMLTENFKKQNILLINRKPFVAL